MSTKDNHAPTSPLSPTPQNTQKTAPVPTPGSAPAQPHKKRRGEYGRSYVKLALIATIWVLVCIQLIGML